MQPLTTFLSSRSIWSDGFFLYLWELAFCPFHLLKPYSCISYAFWLWFSLFPQIEMI
uniref:Uncharacterized protein n=1 Tax=Rhizophora mucronata TaxID=61149 RepID=A0A2P2N774_RHIMU